MKWVLALFVGVVVVTTTAFPVLDPKEDTIQPFSVSLPGNVNPDEYFAKVYANGANRRAVSPPPSPPFGVPVVNHDEHDDHSEESHEDHALTQRIRRSPQHFGGHHGGGHGHYGGHGGGHHGGHGGGHYGGHGGGHYGGHGGGHYGGHGHHYG